MGGDTAATHSGGGQWTINTKKVFRPVRAPHIVVGTCGSMRLLQVMHYHLHVKELPGPTDNIEAYFATYFAFELMETFKTAGLFEDFGEGIEGDILIGYQGHLAFIQQNFQVLMAKSPYMAIGSGSDFALGALYSQDESMLPSDRALVAMQAAAHHSWTAKGPFDLEGLAFDPTWSASKPQRKKKRAAK